MALGREHGWRHAPAVRERQQVTSPSSEREGERARERARESERERRRYTLGSTRRLPCGAFAPHAGEGPGPCLPSPLFLRRSFSLLGPAVPSFPALSGRLKFTVRRHKFNKDSLPSLNGFRVGRSRRIRERVQARALSLSRARVLSLSRSRSLSLSLSLSLTLSRSLVWGVRAASGRGCRPRERVLY